MLEIGVCEPLEAFLILFKIESKFAISEFEFISIMALETDNKSNFLSSLNLSFAVKNPFSLSFFEYKFLALRLNSSCTLYVKSYTSL